VRRGLNLCHSPAKKGVVPMHGYRNVTPKSKIHHFLVPRHVLGTIPITAKKRGWNFAPKDLVRGPVCWATIVRFWKPWKHAFWPPPGCRESFSMLPGHAQSSIVVWNAGDGPWRAAKAELFKCNLLSTFVVDLFQGHGKRTLTNKMQRN